MMKPAELMHHFSVVNIHWINTIILLAGMSPFLFPQKTLKSETAIVVVNVISFCICCSCALADAGNLFIKIFGQPNSTGIFSNFIGDDEIETEMPQPTKEISEHLAKLAQKFRDHLFVYNCIDLAICILAACISQKLIENRIKVSPNVHLTDSRRLQGYGAALIIMSSLGIANHLWQRLLMVNHKQAIFLDMHTIDEFSWLVINLATGVFVLVSAKANQMVQSTAFVLSGATIYPSFFYAWLDYRIMMSANSKFLLKQALSSLMIAIPHIFVLLTIFLTFVMSRRDATRVQLTHLHKLIFVGFSVFFMIISASLINVNLYALFTKQFYKIFHSSEQKLPFLTAFLGIFTGLSVASKFNYITIAASLVIGILAINATYLHIFSYIYLQVNGYFIDGTSSEFLHQVCIQLRHLSTSFLLWDPVKKGVLVLQKTLTLRTALPPPDTSEDSTEELVTKKKYEKNVLGLGVVMLFSAVFVLSLAFYVFFRAHSPHPLVTIYSQLFHVVLALSITSYALFQVLVAEHLSRYPIFGCALTILSIIRGLDILTQIDYKDIGNQPLTWTIHSLVEYMAIFFHFLTIAVIFRIEGAGRPLIEPAEIPMSFENPLGNQTDENGYIMLRTAENEQTD
ncbi:hypothetical protein CAEBREN_14460 [Caenorhabditis brenneri]|uniref:Uncharacterized protein n=1 Tax=Caenorhabditis brenneri TaxID=135651 RepID=G0MVM2_CAEBE|nr:hypothetical protein CAEBREN_14460 [Caenorhabditis brenneri]